MSVKDSRLLDLCDGKLFSEDGFTFDIHRSVLARKSLFFYSMFCGEKDRREVRIPRISGSCIKDILSYIYSDEISITAQNLADLMKANSYMLINGLHARLEQNLTSNIAIGNCLSVFNAAYQMNDEYASRISYRLIETQFEDIIRTQMHELKELSPEIFQKLLRSRNLYVYSEKTVWVSLVKWIERDVSTRLKHVPQLLLSLAAKELDENLAKEIMQHEIVNAAGCTVPLTETQNSHDSYLDALQNFLEQHRDNFHYRIPSHVHVVTSFVLTGSLVTGCDLFVTYDDNLDLWRKVETINDDFIGLSLAVVGHKLFLFTFNTSRQLDLSTQKWIPITNFRKRYHLGFEVHEIDGYIYIIGPYTTQFGQCEIGMDVYDVPHDTWFEGDTWFDGFIVRGLRYSLSVAVEKNIYVVGTIRGSNAMSLQCFNTVTKTMIFLSPPNVFRDCFGLFAHGEDIYLTGGTDYDDTVKEVEIFDTKTNLWRIHSTLPGAPYYPYTLCMNGQMYTYWDDEFTLINGRRMIVRWIEAEGRWEEIEAPNFNMSMLNFFTINDVDTIRFLTKQTRDPKMLLQKSMLGF